MREIEKKILVEGGRVFSTLILAIGPPFPLSGNLLIIGVGRGT